MKIVQELEPSYSKEFRATLVQGADGSHYKIVGLRVYEEDIKNHPNYEVTVYRTDENGKFKVLVGFYRGRFSTKDEAVKDYKRVLQNFDEMFDLYEGKREEDGQWGISSNWGGHHLVSD